MTELRRRMTDDMVVRWMAKATQEAYLAAVVGLARFYRRSPDQISDEEVQAYLIHLMRERKRAWNTCNIVVHGLRFFYHVTLKRDRTTFSIPGGRQPAMGLIRFRGHLPKGGYDVQNGIKQSSTPSATTILGGVQSRRCPAGLG